MQPVKRRIGFDDVDEANEEIAALLALLCDLHTQLNAAGVPPDGTLSERVQAALARMQTAERVIREIYDGQHGSIPHPSKVWKPGIWLVKPVDAYQGHAEWLMDEAALARMQKAERELDDLLHDVGVLSNAGIFVGGDDAEALRSDETTELLIILQAARDTQNDLRYQKRFHADAAQWWKAAAKRWRESYHALDIQYAHRELERDCWKTAAKAFRRRWREACAELEGEARS